MKVAAVILTICFYNTSQFAIAARLIKEKPELYDLKIETHVVNCFATTLVHGKLRNHGKTTISLTLPVSSYITKFTLEMDGDVYEGIIKNPQGDANTNTYLQQSEEDLFKFNAKIKVPRSGEAAFKLYYQELLQRRNGHYEVVSHLVFTDSVQNLDVQIIIEDSNNLNFVRSPQNQSITENAFFEIQRIEKDTAIIKFSAAKNDFESIGDKFVVQYDVNRDCYGGDLLVKDNHFLHFFSPCNLAEFSKHIIFVLDTSSSMEGLKLDQLKTAMRKILGDLHPKDYFTIVEFGTEANIWVGGRKVDIDNEDLIGEDATNFNVMVAKSIVNSFKAGDGTDIKGALEIGLKVAKKAQQRQHVEKAFVVFLTDGVPEYGETDPENILDIVSALNSASPKTTIFCLAFGDNADVNFLQKLSAQNNGFTRHITAVSNSNKQLSGFYHKISSLLLTNISFNYGDSSEVTKHTFAMLFEGSELVVAGKIGEKNLILNTNVSAFSSAGPVIYFPRIVEVKASLEKSWAYLCLKQILAVRSYYSGKKKRILDEAVLMLAKKYRYVTPLSPMLVDVEDEVGGVDEIVAIKRDSKNYLYSVHQNDLDYKEIARNSNASFYEEDFGNGNVHFSPSCFLFLLNAAVVFIFIF